MFPYLQTYNKIHETSHVANAKRLKVLQLLKLRELEMENEVGWVEIKQPCTL